MPVYLEVSIHPTIPHLLARDMNTYFEHGCADRAGVDGVGSGSRLFELNVHMWQYGRQQPRTISVQERLDRKAARLAGAAKRRRAAKRARHDEQVTPTTTTTTTHSHTTHTNTVVFTTASEVRADVWCRRWTLSESLRCRHCNAGRA